MKITDLIASGMPATKAQEYQAQIDRQKARAKKWMQENPLAEVQIVWPQMVVIACISEALVRGWVKANHAGQELIAALVLGETEDDEPTVSMVCASLE